MLSHIPKDFKIQVNNKPLKRETIYKSLGIHINENLTWNSHIDIVTKKISVGLAVLKFVGPNIT